MRIGKGLTEYAVEVDMSADAAVEIAEDENLGRMWAAVLGLGDIHFAAALDHHSQGPLLTPAVGGRRVHPY